jgi:hypothetical protein
MKIYQKTRNNQTEKKRMKYWVYWGFDKSGISRRLKGGGYFGSPFL